MKIALLNFGHLQTDAACVLLANRGYHCHSFSSCAQVLQAYDKEPFDLLVLDLRHPEKESHLVRTVRTQVPAPVPILCIAASANQDEILDSLDAGANDYIATPIRSKELEARIMVLLRRAYPTRTNGERFAFGPYVFEAGRTRVEKDGTPLDVTRKEFDLGLLFFRNLGRPLSRALILNTVWGGEHMEPSRTMDTHVSRVRSKLRLFPEHGFRLAPVYGYGYRLDDLTLGKLPPPAHAAPRDRRTFETSAR